MMTTYPFASSVVTVDRIQFAQNGVWEEVQTVYPDSFKDLYNLSNWLERAPCDIAMETLFMEETSELSGFFGVRTKDSPSAIRTLSWMRLATLAASKNPRPFNELVSLCLGTLELPSKLPKSKPTFEMGVFNFWNTANPLILGYSPLEELKKLIATKSALLWLQNGHESPICLEYVWHQPAHIWISRNISVKSNGRYFVNLTRVENIYYNKD